MGGVVRELLAGSGVCLLVAAVLAFVLAGAWHTSRPPEARGRTGRLMIDVGLGLTAVGLIVAVAGLVPVRSAGSPETLPAQTGVAVLTAVQPWPTSAATLVPASPPP